jgi:hypothetical protein
MRDVIETSMKPYHQINKSMEMPLLSGSDLILGLPHRIDNAGAMDSHCQRIESRLSNFYRSPGFLGSS